MGHISVATGRIPFSSCTVILWQGWIKKGFAHSLGNLVELLLSDINLILACLMWIAGYDYIEENCFEILTPKALVKQAAESRVYIILIACFFF